MTLAILELLPFKKNVFYTIITAPMLLFLAGSYSIDGMCMGFVGLFIAYCLRLYKTKEEVKTKHIVILGTLFILSLLAKEMSYIFICLLLLLLPVTKIVKQNKKSMLIVVLVVIFAILFMAARILLDSGDISDPRSQGTNAVEQVKFLITNPLSAVMVIVTHIRESILNFAWLGYFLQADFFGKTACIFVLQFIFTIYVAVSDNSHRFNTKEKILLIAAFFGSYLVGSLMLYISFTTVGKIGISGYQPRYLFPVLPLLLMVVNNNNQEIDENHREKLSIVMAIFIMIGLVGTISRL